MTYFYSFEVVNKLMKIFELEYKFFQSLRKSRVWLKNKKTGQIVVRYLSVVVIGVNIFFKKTPFERP